MASPGQEGVNDNIITQYWFPFACLGLCVLAGLLIQLFIVAVNVTDWLKGRSVIGADIIITCLELSKVVFHTSCFVYFFSMFYFPSLLRFLAVTLHCAAFSNLCLSTLFSVFIYFKVATFHNVVFLRLKTMISTRVVHLVVVSWVLSAGYSSMYFFAPSLRNSTRGDISGYRHKMKALSQFNLLSNMFPLLLVFTTSTLLIISLGLHVRRFKSGGNVMSNTDAYCRTIHYTSVSFMIWALYFITFITEGYLALLDSSWLLFLVNFFPVIHSVLLMYVATKLRHQFFRMIKCGCDCFSDQENPETQL